MSANKGDLIRLVEKDSLRGEPLDFEVGDTVEVRVRVVEGDKERVQGFSGVVIARRGRGTGASFTVRRMVGEEGVERVFPLHSPAIVGVNVRKQGKVRRAKLYYLRGRAGRRARLAERRALQLASKSEQPAAASGDAASVEAPE